MPWSATGRGGGRGVVGDRVGGGSRGLVGDRLDGGLLLRRLGDALDDRLGGGGDLVDDRRDRSRLGRFGDTLDDWLRDGRRCSADLGGLAGLVCRLGRLLDRRGDLLGRLRDRLRCGLWLGGRLGLGCGLRLGRRSGLRRRRRCGLRRRRRSGLWRGRRGGLRLGRRGGLRLGRRGGLRLGRRSGRLSGRGRPGRPGRRCRRRSGPRSLPCSCRAGGTAGRPCAELVAGRPKIAARSVAVSHPILRLLRDPIRTRIETIRVSPFPPNGTASAACARFRAPHGHRCVRRLTALPPSGRSSMFGGDR